MTKIIRGFNPIQNGYGIELMIEAEGLGVVPYYATPDFKPGTYEEEIYNNAIAGVYGTIAPYSPPPAPVPQIITARQGKLTLLDYGIYQNVIDYIASIPGEAGIRAKISWEAATEFNRNDPVLAAITQALSLTSEEIDQMFIHGASL